VGYNEFGTSTPIESYQRAYRAPKLGREICRRYRTVHPIGELAKKFNKAFAPHYSMTMSSDERAPEWELDSLAAAALESMTSSNVGAARPVHVTR
jgi:hypothetical protein